MQKLVDRNTLAWVMRGLWFAAGLAATGLVDGIQEAFGTGYAHGWVILVVTAVAWAVALGAALTPYPFTLTALRIAMPVTCVLFALTLRSDETPITLGLIALALAAVATALAYSAPIGDRFVDGASYGDERRMLLRPPTGLLLGPIPLAGIAVGVGALAGVLLLGDRRWVVGVIAVVLGLPVAWLAARSLHSLSKRWLVFVPTGLVLHDLTSVLDPVLFPRDAIRFVGPALAETEARDLSVGASGLLLELNLLAETKVPVREQTGRNAINPDSVELDSVLFAPTLPGAALEEAERRKLPVH